MINFGKKWTYLILRGIFFIRKYLSRRSELEALEQQLQQLQQNISSVEDGIFKVGRFKVSVGRLPRMTTKRRDVVLLKGRPILESGGCQQGHVIEQNISLEWRLHQIPMDFSLEMINRGNRSQTYVTGRFHLKWMNLNLWLCDQLLIQFQHFQRDFRNIFTDSIERVPPRRHDGHSESKSSLE